MIGAILLGSLVAVGPYFFGVGIAAFLGAAPGSTARTATGWTFEGIYLALAFVIAMVAFTQLMARGLVTMLVVWLSTLIAGGHFTLGPDDGTLWAPVLYLAGTAAALCFLTATVRIAPEMTLRFAGVSFAVNVFALLMLGSLMGKGPVHIDGFGSLLLLAAVVAVAQALVSSLVGHHLNR